VSTVASELEPPAAPISPALLAEAPHRLLFFAGAGNVLLAMAWWAAWLCSARGWLPPMRQPTLPAGWMHALIMQYQVLPPFIFGFLLTVFPRWLGLPALSKWHYVPVGAGLLGGQLLTLGGLLGYPQLLFFGWVQTLAGWIAALCVLLNLLRRDESGDWHARSAACALLFGLTGIGLVMAWLYTGNAKLLYAAVKFGGFGLLLPIYFTVNHRMTPFFVRCVLPMQKGWNPRWVLACAWGLMLAHLALELAHGYAWLWLPDLPLLALSATLLWRWWPRPPQGARVPMLLRVLLLGFAWLPVALALYSVQSLWLLFTDSFLLGRAPAHALFIGYFGSLLVAMVTRVTQGHSGRALELGRVAGFAFVTVQLVAVLRVCAELHSDPLPWLALAALGWLLAFLPWVLRSAWIYLTPRADGKAG
jgi:uncharacterized protein involved in response to NO